MGFETFYLAKGKGEGLGRWGLIPKAMLDGEGYSTCKELGKT